MSSQYLPDHLLVPLAHRFHCRPYLPLFPEDPQVQRFLLVLLAQLPRSVPVHPKTTTKAFLFDKANQMAGMSQS